MNKLEFVLTNAEFKVLSLMAQNLTNQEIADARGSSKATVEVLIRRIYQKLGIYTKNNLRRKRKRYLAIKVWDFAKKDEAAFILSRLEGDNKNDTNEGL